MRKCFILLCILMTIIVFTNCSKKKKAPIKVGILHSLSGTMAISEKPVMQATLLAIEEINQKGGLLGREIVPVIFDGMSDWPTFAKGAEQLITKDKVSVIFGCWTSASRKIVKPIFEKYNHLLFYPVQYEGLEQSPNIIYTGLLPNQQIFPTLAWATKKFGNRFYLIGSDYIYPRVANWLIKKYALAQSHKIVGEQYYELGARNFKTAINQIQKIKPDFVINTINGDSNFPFFHQYKLAGITASDIPIISFSIGESELSHAQDLNHVDFRGHYSSWSYFQSIKTNANRKFIQNYKIKFGKNKLISDTMQTAWVNVNLWSQAVMVSQTDDVNIVRKVAAYQSIGAPEGRFTVDKNNQHIWRKLRIGKVEESNKYKIVWESDSAIRPSVYPSFITKKQANTYLKSLYYGWDQKWAAKIKNTKKSKESQ